MVSAYDVNEFAYTQRLLMRRYNQVKLRLKDFTEKGSKIFGFLRFSSCC